jgi:hypothetical protein
VIDNHRTAVKVLAMSAAMIIEIEAANISRFVTASALSIWR